MIGFIGLGIMGAGMAENLVEQGVDLVVHNRTKEKAERVLAKGARWADSAATLAEKVDVVFTMLANPQAVEEVALNEEDGFLAHLSPGKLWVDCSTVDPTFTRKMATEAKKRGIRFIDAPVAGSRVPAQQGELVFLVGGEAADVSEVQPLLEAMGKDIKHQGEVGQGSTMKMLINLMLAQSMAAFAETVSLGEALGLNQEMVMDTLLNGPTAAPLFKRKERKNRKWGVFYGFSIAAYAKGSPACLAGRL